MKKYGISYVHVGFVIAFNAVRIASTSVIKLVNRRSVAVINTFNSAVVATRVAAAVLTANPAGVVPAAILAATIVVVAGTATAGATRDVTALSYKEK